MRLLLRPGLLGRPACYPTQGEVGGGSMGDGQMGGMQLVWCTVLMKA